MIQKFFSIAITLLVITACQNQAQKEEKVTHQESEKLHLNEGEKWLANKETHIGMSNLQNLLSTVADSVDYTALASKMGEETQYIIKNCTMKGEDHKQLHLVLHPILDNIAKVEQATGVEDKKNAVMAIKASLADYFTYFETK